MEFPWKTKGIVLTAPLTEEVDNVVKFIDEYLAPRGVNMFILQTRYRYQFKKHPEVWGEDPLSLEDVKKLVSVCKKNNIKLIPKMNLIGHQSGHYYKPSDGILHGHGEVEEDMNDGLLRAYPEFDEQPNEASVFYSRSICLSNEKAMAIILELIDEMMDAFEADSIHIGCDEVFSVGVCEKCAKKTKAELIANWINTINEHVKKRNGKVLIWGDRLLSMKEMEYDYWEASNNETEGALDLLSRDVIVCDWHYYMREKYASVDVLGNAGFEIYVCPWRDMESAEAFLNYAKEHDKGHIKGVLATTWCGSGELARRLLYGEQAKWQHTEQIAQTIEKLFD